MSYLDDARNRGLNDYQLSEVKEGLKHLTTDQVDLYANTKYDHLQMREIRLALEEGLTKEQIDVFLNPEISWQTMEHNRRKIKNGNVFDENAAAKLHGKRLRNTFLFILILLLAIVIMAGSYFGKMYLDIKNQVLEILLTDSEITLEYGKPFNPGSYVKRYTKADNVEFELPAPIDTNELGDFTVEYTIKNQLKTDTVPLLIHIVDLEAPVITLSNQEVTLTRGEDKFSCKTYLVSAVDDVDGDITEQVECGNSDESKDEQEIEYSVNDSSGNTGSVKLKLRYVDPKPAPTPETIVIYQSAPGGNTQQSTQQPPKDTTSHGSQDFMFAAGYDMDSGYQACIAAGSAHISYNCSPLQDEEGYYIGYRLKY